MKRRDVGALLVLGRFRGFANDFGHHEGGPAHRLNFFLERLTSSGLNKAIASVGVAIICKCQWKR
jgi:hypothetical protein